MELNKDLYPIDSHLEEIRKSLKTNSTVLIKAETGAGKTTRLPPYLLGSENEKVLVLEPRRLAAKLSAQRCAHILGDKLGNIVGHHIRYDKKSTEQTRLLFITEGLFLQYLQDDPSLESYTTIIIDEFHERSIHTDIALCMIKKLQRESRPDLKLIIMSATLNTELLENYLREEEKELLTFHISGRTYPLDIEYHNSNAKDAVIDMINDKRCRKNILVFLPGVSQINKLRDELKDNRELGHYQIVPLYSSLPPKEQKKAFEQDGPKVILSTNIAETSLTLPNITGVIDLGLEKRSNFAPWSGMPLLLLEKISQASAIQRAGRAGRIEKGLVYRLYDEGDFTQRSSFTPPEIERVELSKFILILLKLGYDPYEVDWFEKPPQKNLDKAYELLNILNCIKENEITETGNRVASYPLHPRIAAMIDHSIQSEYLNDILLAAAIISEGFTLRNRVEFNEDDNEFCDLALQSNLIKSFYWKDSKLSDYSQKLLDFKQAAKVIETYESLAKKFNKIELSKRKTDPLSLQESLLAGFPDRVATKRKTHSYNFCLGRGGILSKRSSLISTLPEYIIVLDALENPKLNAARGTTINMASSIQRSIIETSRGPLRSTSSDTDFNEKKGTLTITKKENYGKLLISKKVEKCEDLSGDILCQLIKTNWPWPFEDSYPLELYHYRVKILDELNIDHQCPVFEDEMLELFIESLLEDIISFKELKEQDLGRLIMDQLAPQDIYNLDYNAPLKILLDNGKETKIEYTQEGPLINMRIQDLYSTDYHPSLGDNQIPLKINLLSPANRIAQVTCDLPSFWKSSWDTVKKDLKSRYPKHFWPEDPVSASPTRLKSKI